MLRGTAGSGLRRKASRQVSALRYKWPVFGGAVPPVFRMMMAMRVVADQVRAMLDRAALPAATFVATTITDTTTKTTGTKKTWS